MRLLDRAIRRFIPYPHAKEPDRRPVSRNLKRRFNSRYGIISTTLRGGNCYNAVCASFADIGIGQNTTFITVPD